MMTPETGVKDNRVNPKERLRGRLAFSSLSHARSGGLRSTMINILNAKSGVRNFFRGRNTYGALSFPNQPYSPCPPNRFHADDLIKFPFF